VIIRTCPACGRDSPADRPRCYNCNASLEREPFKDAPRISEAPTEKRTRPAVDLWTEDYTPPAQQAERMNVQPGSSDDAAGSFNRSRMVRGPMAADADQFQPPRRPGRGSSGDPSEIAPSTKRPTGSMGPVDAAAPATPVSRTRPKTGEFPLPKLTGGEGRTAALGAPWAPADAPPPMPEGPLLEPNRRGGTGRITPAPPPSASPPASPAEAAAARGPSGSPVLDAVQAANVAAKTRKPIDPKDLADYSNALETFEEPVASPPSEPAPPVASPPPVAREEPRPETDLGTPSARPRAIPDGSSSIPHYLVAAVLQEPVALARNEVVRIGRGDENEVIFPLSQVSRHHAEVRFDPQAGAYVIVDRNSINGTFVNGKSVKRRRLADGDRIGIGPFTIVYRASTGGQKPRAMDETDVIRPGSLAGELADMPIPDVVRFIEALKKTGELTVITGGERGTVIFREGNPVHAEFKVALGPPAAVALFKLKAGNFRFSVKPIELPKLTISQPLAALLSEAGV
jgi:pSer/pThr/pTyr-binding forkhead associated (FHA) protein